MSAPVVITSQALFCASVSSIIPAEAIRVILASVRVTLPSPSASPFNEKSFDVRTINVPKASVSQLTEFCVSENKIGSVSPTL